MLETFGDSCNVALCVTKIFNFSTTIESDLKDFGNFHNIIRLKSKIFDVQSTPKIKFRFNPLPASFFSTTRPQDLCFCLIIKKCVKVSTWMLCIFIHEKFLNKLCIVGCSLVLSIAVKYTRNKSHRAWSLPVWDTDKTVKGLILQRALLALKHIPKSELYSNKLKGMYRNCNFGISIKECF